MIPPRYRLLCAVAACGLAAVVLLFHDCVGSGLIYDNHDVMLQQLPFAAVARESWARGEPPFWNPAVWGGTPYLASGNPGALAPLTVLTVPLPLEMAFTAQACLALLGAFAGTALLAWRRTRDPAAAATAGLAYMLAAPVLLRAYAGHVTLLGTCWLIPWLLLAGEVLLAGGGAGAAAGVAACVGGLLLGGMPQVAYLALLACAGWVAVPLAREWRRTRDWRPGLRPLAWLGLGVACGVALAAPQLLPGVEFAAHSTRQGGLSRHDALWGSVGLRHLKYLFLPLADGDFSKLYPWVQAARPTPDELQVTYWEVCGFFGLLTLGLAGVAAVAGRGRAALWLAGISFAGALGRDLPVYAILHALVPGFALFRVPGRLLILVALGLALAAGEGVAAWRDPGEVGQRARQRGVWVAAGLVACLGLLTVAVRHDTRHGDDDGMPRAWLAALAFGGMAAAFRLAAPDARRWLAPAAAGLLGLELVGFAWPFTRPLEVAASLWPPEVAGPLREAAKGWRVDVLAPDGPAPNIRPNDPLRHGLRSAGGYDPAVLRRTMQLYNAANGLPDPRALCFVSQIMAVSPLTPLLHCRYAIGRDREKPPPGLKPLLESGRYGVYELPALPRAFLVHGVHLVEPDRSDKPGPPPALLAAGFRPADEAVVEATAEEFPPLMQRSPEAPRPPVRIVEDAPHRVACEAETEADALLVLCDGWYPGWTATVDGTPARIFRADHAWRGVRLAPGRHTIVFAYTCAPFRTGCALAVLGMVLLGALALAARRRSRQEPAPAA